MVPDLFELRPSRSIRSEKEFLKHDGIDRKVSTAICFGGKQLYRCPIASQIVDDHARVQKHEWSPPVGTSVFSPVGLD